MKMKLLASCIASAFLVTGCGGGGSSDPLSSATSAEVVAPASVNISAVFPESAQAAAIDANAQSIAVVFYPSEAGSIEEAKMVAMDTIDCLQEEYNYMNWDCLPHDGEPLGEPSILTAGSPSVALELIPGKYRVVAYQFATATPTDTDIPISASSSFATLTQGAHSLELNMVHASWDAATSVSLQLLNQPVTDDTGAVIDLDPNTAGDQTAADLLELTDQPIVGLHLVGMPTFEAEVDAIFNSGSSTATAAFEEFPVNAEDPEDAMYDLIDYWLGESLHIPVLRQSTSTPGTETVAWWWDDPTMGGYCNIAQSQTETGELCVERDMSPSRLLQDYTPTSGNMNAIDLGEVWASYDQWNFDGTSFEVESAIFTAPFLLETPDITTDGTTVSLTWAGGDQEAHVFTDEVETLSGFETLNLLNFSDGSGSTEFPDDANRVDQVDAPSVTGGTTITGTLIEFQIQFSEEQVASEVPTVPGDITPNEPTTAIMATQAAVAAGLMAQPAATANGDNCSTLTEMFSGAFSQYIWDETTSSWAAGTRNHSYFASDTDGDGVADTITGDDLNGDGSIDPFEVGVFYNNTCTWDDVTQMQVCDDLDGVAEDNTDQYETVLTGWQETGAGEYCLHPVTLTASQLTFSFSDTLSATEVTVQGSN